jgi:hypothetical protein
MPTPPPPDPPFPIVLRCVFEPHHGCHERPLPRPAGQRPPPLTYPVRRPDEQPMAVTMATPHAAGITGVFQLISLLAGFHWRLRPEVLRDVRQAIRGLGLPSRYLGVHLRRGDACANFGSDQTAAMRKRDRWCPPVSDFAAEIARMTKRYALGTVYVATDEARALDALRRQLPRSLTVVGAPATRFSAAATNASRSIELAMHLASADEKRRAAVEVATDVVVLAQSSAFVASFSSMLSRIALELAFFHRGVVPPFVSMEFSYCWGGYGYVPVKVRGGTESRYPC